MSRIEIRLLTQFQQMHHLLQAKEAFEAANPHVRIIVEQAADNFESMREFESVQPPDIMDSGGWGLFNQEGVFIDLMPYIKEIEGMEEDWYPGIIRVAGKDGTLPGLPVDVSVPLILINKDMFDREGLTYPKEDWTWEDMMGLAQRLTLRNEDGIARQFGFATGADIENFEPFVMRNGGRYLSPDGSTARGYVDSESTIEAFRKIIDMYRIHQVTRKPGEPSLAGQLADGFAIVFGFTWFLGGICEKGREDQFEVVGLPRMQGGEEANMIYMGGCGVTTKSKHPRLAWDFLRHYILERHESFLKPWNLPVTRTLAQRSGMNTHRLWKRYLKELEVVQPSGFYLNEKWNTSRQLINEDIHRMINEGADVRHLLKSWTRFA
ncbi:extracellular solute-binding protein [Paenibacillus radicis (ex Xue et al. 2023)]|uniref:Extracellular solute-binding protein n=1 Tax=Paenibacillus radicis (ex Xue et al. 2023) TaxID=2972489 RepID=A0ABT1YBE3_9BACL|nr:extracellular solute-binding protein [Paenibacillus radicis (ex Xue et al. 2023)]MCR8630514.1 extracellular solute-binding protein [Paenibacillus radicis (ex Xue et al. 2023)]